METLRLKSLGGWGLAVVASALLNFSLFALMPGLIQGIPDLDKPLEGHRQIQVIRVKKEEPPLVKKEQEPMKPPEKMETRSQAMPQKTRSMDIRPRLAFEINPHLPAVSTDLNLPAIEEFSMDAPVVKGSYEIGELDAPLTTLVKIDPLYPIRAKRRKIEGFVTVEFLVTNTGQVEQIKIIEAEPQGVFEKNVIESVSKWRFKPGTVQGIPVVTRVLNTIRYKMEE